MGKYRNKNISPTTLGSDPVSQVLAKLLNRESAAISRKTTRTMSEFKTLLNQLDVIKNVKTKLMLGSFVFEHNRHTLDTMLVMDDATKTHALNHLFRIWKKWLEENQARIPNRFRKTQ